MLRITEEKKYPSLFDITCAIYDANMMSRAIAELDPHQMAIPCWHGVSGAYVLGMTRKVVNG